MACFGHLSYIPEKFTNFTRNCRNLNKNLQSIFPPVFVAEFVLKVIEQFHSATLHVLGPSAFVAPLRSAGKKVARLSASFKKDFRRRGGVPLLTFLSLILTDVRGNYCRTIHIWTFQSTPLLIRCMIMSGFSKNFAIFSRLHDSMKNIVIRWQWKFGNNFLSRWLLSVMVKPIKI